MEPTDELVENFHPSTLDPSTPCCMGIDEAGRGPVLGPMVYGSAYCPIENKQALGKMGFADSKTLSEGQRDSLFAKMNKSDAFPLGWMTEVLEPEELSKKMLLANKVSLNVLSHNAAIQLIRRTLALNVNLQEIFVDTVGVASRYQSKLEHLFPGIKIVVSKKADSIYPIVSAASIVAKVSRDSRLKHWQFKEKHISPSTKFGSGYPSDPNTQYWLKNNVDPVFGFPSVLRFSWKTADVILDKAATDVLWSEVDLSLPEIRTRDRGLRYKYFAENNMELVTEFE